MHNVHNVLLAVGRKRINVTPAPPLPPLTTCELSNTKKKQTNLKDSLYQHFTRIYCTNKWDIIFICKTISTMPLCAPTHQMSASSCRIFNKSTFGLPWGWQFNCRASISLVDVSACHLTVSPDYHIPTRTMTWRKRPRSVDISRAVAFWPPVFPGKPQAPIVSSSCVTLCSLSTAHITWPFSH